MKLLLKQRFLSWFDSYNVYDENENVVYIVKGQPNIGHLLNIYDNSGRQVGAVKEVVFAFKPQFELYVNDMYVGLVKKKFALFGYKYETDFKGWKLSGDVFGWNFDIRSPQGKIATITDKPFSLTDTYEIEITDPADALMALMLALAIDAEKCSKN